MHIFISSLFRLDKVIQSVFYFNFTTERSINYIKINEKHKNFEEKNTFP